MSENPVPATLGTNEGQPLSRRQFVAGAGLGSLALATRNLCSAAGDDTCDVVVIGGTPGGIATAVTAARLGRRVTLVEYHRHLGAISSSGLGKSDIENRAVIQGFFREFVDRVKQHYQTLGGENSDLV